VCVCVCVCVRVCVCVCVFVCVCVYNLAAISVAREDAYVHCLLFMCNVCVYYLVLMRGIVTVCHYEVSFAKEPYKRDDILRKRPAILRRLLIVATPYAHTRTRIYVHAYTHTDMYLCAHVHACIHACEHECMRA